MGQRNTSSTRQSFELSYSLREDCSITPFVSSVRTDNSYKCTWNWFQLYTPKSAIPLELWKNCLFDHQQDFYSCFLRCLRHKERTNSSSKSHILLRRTKVKDYVEKAPIAKPAKMKANQISLFQWCSDVREMTNQIIFHTFLKKSRGLWTRLSTANHRRSFPIFFEGKSGCTQATKHSIYGPSGN